MQQKPLDEPLIERDAAATATQSEPASRLNQRRCATNAPVLIAAAARATLWRAARKRSVNVTREPTAGPDGRNSATAESLRARLREDLKAAMKARDTVETQVLRGLLAAIDNAEAVPLAPEPGGTARLSKSGSPWVATGATFGSAEVARRALDADELKALLQSEIDQRAAAAIEMERGGKPEHAERARAEIRIVERYSAGLGVEP